MSYLYACVGDWTELLGYNAPHALFWCIVVAPRYGFLPAPLHGVDPGTNYGDTHLVNSVLSDRRHGIGPERLHAFPHNACLFTAGIYKAGRSNSEISPYGSDIDNTHVSLVGVNAKIEG